MKILVLENNLRRLKFFVDFLGKYKLNIIDNAEEAEELLRQEEFDMVFLDNDLDGGGFGADIASFLAENPENPNNNAAIVIHCLDNAAREAMFLKLSSSCENLVAFPFGSTEFFEYLGLTSD